MGTAEWNVSPRDAEEAKGCDYCGHTEARRFICKKCGQECCSNCCKGFFSWSCPECGGSVH